MSANDSFEAYRKTSDELISSDEDEIVESSYIDSTGSGSVKSRLRCKSNLNSQQGSVEIRESSESDDDNEPILRSQKKNRLRILTESDSDESDVPEKNHENPSADISKLAISVSRSEEDLTDEEDVFERRALSPRTRMSITGIRPKEMTDDESDFYEESSSEKSTAGTASELKDINEKPASNENVQNGENSFSWEEEKLHEKNNENSSADMSKLAISASGSERNLTDEEEEVFERRALSPRTRMSITGIRPKEMTDDESNFYEESSSKKSTDGTAPELKDISEKPASNENVKNGENPFSDEEDELHSFNPEQPPQMHTTVQESVNNNRTNDSADGKLYTVNNSRMSGRKSILAPRTSANFNASITDKHSSTMITWKIDENKPFGDEKSGVICTSSPIIDLESPVTLLPVKGSTIEISSESDVSVGSSSTPTRGAVKSLVQPKIISLLDPKKEQKSMTECANGIKYVSQDYYDTELRKLNDLKAELSTCETIVNTLAAKLPDKGKRMSGRGERLKQEIKELAIYISTLKVDESFRKKSFTDIEPQPPKLNAPSWDELTKAANAIQPTHTGKIGIANFMAQKTLTIERLKDIHGSLDTCPAENVLADDPKYLKVALMNHQKHALAWMNWREKQKPPGGILADDMGLGKTLTMISLILACSQREGDEEKEEESISDEEEGNSNSAWKRKGKRDYYYGGTLVVCPASLIRQWEGEVENRVKRSKISVCVYHGNNREDRPRTLAKYDMVVTTYSLIPRDYKANGTLYAIKWERIILDEAHCIRNYKSQASEAVCKLKGRRRWALTGTPIHNKEMDLYALLKFLKCSPFDELPHWKRWIESKSAGGQQRLNTLMKSLMLRRTKQQLQQYGSLTLPEKSLNMVEVFLDKDEMAVYQKLIIYSRTLFAQFLQQRAEKHSDFVYDSRNERPTGVKANRKEDDAFYKLHQRFVRLDRKADVRAHEILVLLLRLRQVCCHPGLIDSMLEDEGDLSAHNDDSDTRQEIDLLEQMNNLNLNDANNSAGNSESLSSSKDEAISKALSKVLLKSNPVFDLKRLSSKMKKIIQTVEEKVLKTTEKALIVSQWTSVLDILKGHLARMGIVTVSLNGSVPVKLRNDIVNNFNNPSSDKKIMLLSLTAGGVGLNLVGANHLLLIDLHWNPQLEAQAQDRIYRVGQNKQVHIYKFMCKDTIEERIKSLQDKKLALAQGVLTGVKSTEGSKLSIDDLKTLFGL